MLLSRRVSLLVALGLAAPLAALAGTSPQTATFTVTATVIKSCVVTTTPIAFGSYDPTSATAVTASGAVSAKCTKGAQPSVALDQGQNKAAASTAAVPARQMSDGAGDLLPYHIYTASAGTTEWGNTTAQEPASQTSTSVNTALSFPTYGNLPAGADVPAGSYSDTVTATVTF